MIFGRLDAIPRTSFRFSGDRPIYNEISRTAFSRSSIGRLDIEAMKSGDEAEGFLGGLGGDCPVIVQSFEEQYYETYRMK